MKRWKSLEEQLRHKTDQRKGVPLGRRKRSGEISGIGKIKKDLMDDFGEI